MPMSVTYATVNGRLMEENRNGVITRYIPDTLGNFIKTADANGNITSETTYWPYGEIRTQTGTNPSPFGFCGTWGYYTSTNLPTYVRARYYRPAQGRWQTVDPLWPWQRAYSYTSRPTQNVDPSGTFVSTIGAAVKDFLLDCYSLGCNDKVKGCMNVERAVGKQSRSNRQNAVGHCLAACCIKRHVPDCVFWWNEREKIDVFAPWESRCMDTWNNNVGFELANKSGSCFDLCMASEKLVWIDPTRHRFPPPGGCGSRIEPTPPCNGKICPAGSFLKVPSCVCVWL